MPTSMVFLQLAVLAIICFFETDAFSIHHTRRPGEIQDMETLERFLETLKGDYPITETGTS